MAGFRRSECESEDTLQLRWVLGLWLCASEPAGLAFLAEPRTGKQREMVRAIDWANRLVAERPVACRIRIYGCESSRK
jgi:hypothetical protein